MPDPSDKRRMRWRNRVLTGLALAGFAVALAGHLQAAPGWLALGLVIAAALLVLRVIVGPVVPGGPIRDELFMAHEYTGVADGDADD